MSEPYASGGNDPVAAEATADYLLDGGTAVGAVAAGYFAAAGAHAGVLLGPASILVAGIGLGARAFDGRSCQPGLGTKRPRGFQEGEEAPDAARIAVPCAVAAVLVAHAYDSGDKLGKILKVGISRARSAGADARAALLRRIRVVGAAALGEPSFMRPLLHVAGPSEGGLLTPADFSQVPEIDHAAERREVAGKSLLVTPWSDAEPDDPEQSAGVGCVVSAVDRRGVFAAIAYRRVLDGLLVDELELEAPALAVPVSRGKTRVKPGARLATPVPVAFELDGDAPMSALAAPSAAGVHAEWLKSPKIVVRRG